MSDLRSIQTIIEQILTHMPPDWTTLTTHRLDIYDESQAKVEFVERLQRLMDTGIVNEDTLAALPTAYDYVRLGHQLSSVLEWAIANLYGVSTSQIISFASKTMPLLAILRSNTVHHRHTLVYHDCALPDVLSLQEIGTVYGYLVEFVRVETIQDISEADGSVVVYVTDDPLIEGSVSPHVDAMINLSSYFGTVLVLHPRDGDTVATWVSEVQHVRRRECIAVTPPYAKRMLEEMIGRIPESLETITAEDWTSIANAVKENTGTVVQPLLASSGLSTQYAIMMGLLDHARQFYSGKPIHFLIPPNCYGGTNDQARRVAALCTDVSIVDLPVDSGHTMTGSLERRLDEAAKANAVPYVLVEIPTNPRVEVPDMKHLEEVLTSQRQISSGEEAVPPLFIIDQTFCPNVRLLSDESSLSEVQTLAYVSGSKFPSGGRCTAGYVTANQKGAVVMDSIAKHLRICDNQATPLQMKILAEMMPSMAARIAKAYTTTRQFVDHIRQVLPNTKISFIDDELVSMGFTPSVFSLDLPSKGDTPEEREENKRLLNLRMINHIISAMPNDAKHCVSYGQLAKTYFTVPATSTQGTTKESDKDYIVRISMPPEMDMGILLEHFDIFVRTEKTGFDLVQKIQSTVLAKHTTYRQRHTTFLGVMMSLNPTILYTKTDEAPALATFSFLPIIRAFTKSSGIEVGFKDISLAGRILSQFPEYLSEEQRVEDALAELGRLTQDPTTNIIKLPNISASLPQLLDAVAELQGQGFAIPDYPNNPQGDEDKSVKARYDKVRGSAVNPVLREGNSDRRAPKAVKTYAQNNPHRMGAWSADSKSHVAHMSGGDFFGSEQSRTFDTATSVDIVHVGTDGQRTVLKSAVAVAAGEIVDTSRMSKAKLVEFIHEQIDDAKAQGILFSVHLKATMMKVSDPIIFGHFVKAFYAELFAQFPELETEYGFNANNGIADLDGILEKLDADKRSAVEDALANIYASRPDMAMVDSDKGITNLHVPNNVIIDASMPAALKTSGRMWNKEGKTQDTKFVIPDRSYAGMYQEVITFCKEHGAFDVTTMGSVSNVGLMAKKAEEYGSHDKTFEIASNGTVVVENNGEVVFSHDVQTGDIWRMCMVKDIAIRDWVKLAVTRARAVGAGVFWLNENRAHDAQLIKKVNAYLPEHNTEGLELHIASPEEAMKYTLKRVQAGQDTVSITGNVLRDYLTDLFPILELNTSAKMLSIVPLMKGGGLFETGAGGSAPKHVEQLVKENYLRWDSLGEFLALAVSLDHLSDVHGNAKAKVLGATLDDATTKLLQNNKSPARRLGQIDNRGSHFYLAMYWAQELAAQSDDADLKTEFASIAETLTANEDTIVSELNAVQRNAVKLEGYFNPSEAICVEVMRPSTTFNALIDGM